jgi:predicted regulator of Ras-like GTPase activity (Roadblock/LC7/MglB family)
MTGDKLLTEMQALRDRIAGVTGTAVASRDGLIIREDTGGVNPDNLAALTSAALSLAQRLAREAGQGTLREAVTRSSGGYVAIYAIGTSAVLVLLGDEGLDVTRMHRESRSVVENIEKLLALAPAPGTAPHRSSGPETVPYSARPRIEASSTSAVCATAMS